MKKIWEALKKPFTESDIEWRVCRSGVTNDRAWIMCLCYVTNRAIMDRLDEIVGAENWKNEFKQAPEGGILCGISIKVKGKINMVDKTLTETEWVTKWDGAENTDVESVKGGLSSAMKRAAVQWGIGRYLYRLEENFADISPEGRFKARVKDKTSGVYQNVKWAPPGLPGWAIPLKGKPTPTKKKKAPGKGKIKDETEGVLGSELPSMVNQSLDEILNNPPKAVNKKQPMIDKIMNMTEELPSDEWDQFKAPRIGNRGLTNLSEEELIKLGTDLRDLIAEKKSVLLS